MHARIGASSAPQTPAWLTPERIANVAMVLASVVASPFVLQALGFRRGGRGPDVHPGMLMMTTGVLTLVVAHRAPRARSASTAAGWCLVGSGLLGALNAGAVLAGTALVSPGAKLWEVAVVFLIGSLFGSIIGLPVGVAYGVTFLVPALAAHKISTTRSHAGAEHMLIWAGIWLAVIAGGSAALLVHAPRHGMVIAFVCAAAATNVGLCAAAAGAMMMRRRRRWLSRVENARVAGWAVRDLEVDPPEDVRPFVLRSPDACTQVLTRRVATPGAAPYRDGVREEPVALC